jgi:hypothetical protein
MFDIIVFSTAPERLRFETGSDHRQDDSAGSPKIGRTGAAATFARRGKGKRYCRSRK